MEIKIKKKVKLDFLWAKAVSLPDKGNPANKQLVSCVVRQASLSTSYPVGEDNRLVFSSGPAYKAPGFFRLVFHCGSMFSGRMLV